MQAIQTKYICASNTKNARIKAWCEAGSLTISYPDEMSGQACHRKAAEALLVKLGWTDPAYGIDGAVELLGGSLPGNAGYCFILNNQWAKE